MGSRQFIVEVLDAQGVVVQRIPVDGVSLVASSVTGATPSTAATFSKVDGDNQTSAVSTAVTAAPSVKVVDASGLPVSGVSVSFIQLSSRSGVVAGAQQTTSGAGIATCTSWSLGTIVGTQRMEVKAGSLSTQTFTATAVAGSAFSISASGGTSQTTHAGAALPSRITVLVHDSWSNPVNGAVVTLTSTDNEGVFGSSTLTTVDTSGVTGTTYAVGSVAPSVASMLAAISSTSSARFDATSTVSAAANISIIQGDNQVGLISTALPTNPNVRITDTYGNQLTSSQVTWVIVAGGGSLSTSRTPTGSTGTAQTVWTLGGTPGLGQLEARGDFTSASTVTFDISISNPQADTIALIAGNSQSRGVGLDLTSRLTVATTGTGLPSQGVVTTWSVPNPAPGSDGTLGAATVNTGSDGSAGNTYSVGTTAGTKTITVSATGLTGSPILFTVSATTAANSSLTMIAQPSSNINDGQVFPQQPQVQIIDLYGNKCLSNAVTVTASKSAGGATLGGTLTASTGATGLATFTNLSGSGAGQSLTLAFASSGLTSVTANAVNIAAPVGSQLAFTVQPGSLVAGATFSPTVVVAVQDSLGQTVPGATDLIALTVSVGGVLTGVVAVQAIAGLATFSGLGESATGTFTLTATSGTLTPATSASFTASAASSNEPTDVTMTAIVTITVDTLTTDLSLVNGTTYGDTSLQMTKQSGTIVVRDMSGNQSWRDAGASTIPSPPTGTKALVVPFGAGASVAAGEKGRMTKTALGGAKTLYYRDYFLISSNWVGQADSTTKTVQGFITGDTNNALCNLRGTGGAAIYASLTMQNTGNNVGHHPTVAGTTNYTRNVWVKREILWVTESAANAADGHATLWLDGTKKQQVTGVDWSATAGAGVSFTETDLISYFGGTSATNVPTQQYLCRAGVYASKSASRAAAP